jgi:hypothetical protein
MEALGRLFDISLGIITGTDLSGGFTGKRICMENYGGIACVLVASAVGTTDDPVPSIQQHTAYTGGTSADLATMDTIYRKSETLLDGDEAWTKTTQTAATIMTAVAGEAEKQNIYYWEVEASDLADTYTHISVNYAALGTDAKLGVLLYIPYDLKVQRTPANMPNPLNPGAANA